jgi:gliding motility-associated-like protein
MKIKPLYIFFSLLLINTKSYPQIVIRFFVDMIGQTIESGGVHIAGQFALDNSTTISINWEPAAPGSQLSLVSGSTYSVDVAFPASSAGLPLEFEFVRNNIWWDGVNVDYSEGNPGDPNAYLDNSCGVPDGGGGFNRIITIPACGGVFTAVWNRCGVLSSVPPPSLTVSQAAGICPGASVQLSAITNGTLMWSPSAGLSCSACNNPLASPLTTTLYKVNSIIGSCSASDSVLVTVDTTYANAGDDKFIQPGGSVQLHVSGSSTILWQPATGLSCTGCPSPVASPLVTTTYIVTGTSLYGCVTTDTVIVFVGKSPCQEIYFPNTFTPDGDGKNETFGPLSRFNQSIRVFRVYNRWGQLIFETKDFNHKWDGKFGGVHQSSGIYVYYLQVDCDGKTTVIKGTVALLR